MKMRDLSLNFLLFLLSFFVRKKKGLFLIGAKSGEVFAENSKYLYLYANKIKKNSNFMWFTKNRELYAKLKKLNLPVVYAFSFKAFLKILRAEKLIISSCPREVSYYRYLFGKYRIVQLWHGNIIKSVNFTKNKKWLVRVLLKKQHSMFEFVLHTSKKTEIPFAASFNGVGVKILGYPRNDFRNKEMNSFFNFYNTDFASKKKKTYLYLPTFRDSVEMKVSLSKDFLKKIERLMDKQNGQFIIKNHTSSKIITDDYRNIIDISNKTLDVQELLVKADVMISDYSSAVFDFSLLGKPIIFYSFDFDQYVKKCRSLELDYYKDLPGPFAHSEEELFNYIAEIERWSSSKKYKKSYEKFRKDFNDFSDSNSSERVYNEIVK